MNLSLSSSNKFVQNRAIRVTVFGSRRFLLSAFFAYFAYFAVQMFPLSATPHSALRTPHSAIKEFVQFADKAFPRFRIPAFPLFALTFVPWLLRRSKICFHQCLVALIGSAVKRF